MRKENRLVDYERSNEESIAEDFHVLSDWQKALITKRLVEADSGDEGIKHGEVFGQLKRCLRAKI